MVVTVVWGAKGKCLMLLTGMFEQMVKVRVLNEYQDPVTRSVCEQLKRTLEYKIAQYCLDYILTHSQDTVSV